MSKYILYLLFMVVISIVSCSTGVDEDIEEIRTYLSTNGIKFTHETDGSYIIIDEPGTFDRPNDTSIVYMRYTGRYLDNVIFDDQWKNTPVSFKLMTAINGLQDGLLYFGRQGKGKIIIPAAKAYGNNPPRGLRDNAILRYDIEVVNF
jgi:FKBP-type peptidyl-prolyl cis-trans isomerase